MIGSSAKNSGKTTLSTYLIANFSKRFEIIGLKAKINYSSFADFHFNNDIIQKQGFDIYQETAKGLESDTSKMLLAGASQAFFLQAKFDFLNIAVENFKTKINNNSLIICESNSLVHFFKPDLFILIKSKNENNVKSNYEELKSKADLIIESDGFKFDFDINKINFNEKWKIV